jgi:hypothetical protein
MKNIFNKPEFTWGKGDLAKPSVIRRNYIDALGLADNGDIKPLLKFAKS